MLRSLLALLVAALLVPGCSDDDGPSWGPLLIFVGYEGNGDLLQFTDAGAGSLILNGLSVNPFVMTGLTYDPASDTLFYASKNGDRRIYRVTLGGVETPFASFRPDGVTAINATDIALSPSGQLHVLSLGGTNKIIRFDASGVGTEIHDTGNGNTLLGLAVSPAGIVYYSDFTNHEVRQVTGPATSVVIADATDGLNGSRGLAVDSAGRLLVASFNTDQVYRFTGVHTGAVFVDAADGVTDPADLAIDPVTQHVFISGAGTTNALFRFDSSGTAVGVQPFADAGDGLSNPRSVAVNR
jgi:streptogramin lyase